MLIKTGVLDDAQNLGGMRKLLNLELAGPIEQSYALVNALLE